MAKPNSSDIVDDQAEAVRKFENLSDKVDKIFIHLGLDGKPKPKGEPIPDDKPPIEKTTVIPSRTGIPKVLEELGILSKD